MQSRLGRKEFAKYHALGNDYIVVDRKGLGALTPARVRAICDRHLGVGSDGILVLTASRLADFGVRIFNPDGSEAEKSGNGVRIFARFLFEFGYTRRRTLSIETPGGVVQARLLPASGAVRLIDVDMGRASFLSSRIPARGPGRDIVGESLKVDGRTLRVTCVSVGNPHCVIFVPKLSVDELRCFGPLVERHPTFPQRINVQFARVRSRSVIDALIWERGAGETLASGSSSCAVAAAAVRNGLTDGRVEVRMPGGTLRIVVSKQFDLRMTGPATPVYRGRLLEE